MKRRKQQLRLVGITGNMRAGKDSIANVLMREYLFKRAALADPLKSLADRIGWDGTKDAPEDYAATHSMYWLEKPNHHPRAVFGPGAYNGRLLLQELGVGARAIIGEDVWVEVLHRKILGTLAGHRVVVPDVRFHNEARAIREWGGEVWRVTRPGFEGDAHESERQVANIEASLEIVNDGTLEDLAEKVRKVMR